MDIATRNLMKKKKEVFKKLSLKVRDILFFQTDCFEKMMLAGGKKSFDYQAFFELIATQELLSDLKRHQMLKDVFLPAVQAYQTHLTQSKKISQNKKEDVFFDSPDRVLQNIGFFYDVYSKSRAIQTYYALSLKKMAGDCLKKEEEEKMKYMNPICFELEAYLVQHKLRAVEKMFLTYGQERICCASKKIQSSIDMHPMCQHH
ncbi:MAG: hypothetical protein J6V53_03425 [Alphaproteobacteria bacterium]|nr:hypothetical protein [Alphaproteobacteria bacterium]